MQRDVVRPEPRVVMIGPATVFVVLGIAVLVGLGLILIYLAWQVLTWIFVAAVLACALNPAVDAIERKGLRRGYAAAIVFTLALLVLTGIGFLIVPPLITQVSEFVEAVPGARGRPHAGTRSARLASGRLPDRRSHPRGHRRPGSEWSSRAQVLPVLDIVRSVVTAVVGVITIVFLTFFMLLEGPRTIRGALDLLSPRSRLRYERVGYDIYRTISGYVTGNLLISLVAGVTSTAVLFGVGSDFAIALGLLVGILDLIPLAGATLAAIIVSTVVLLETDWLRAIIVIGFFLAYQQLENHVLQPLVYGKTVELSPLTVLIAILIGAQLAGVLGALMAIPVAGTLLAIGRELLHYQRTAAIETPPGVDRAIDHPVAEN